MAALPFGSGALASRLSRLGGTLSLTDEELIFTPLWHLGRTRRFPLQEIQGAIPSGEKPPRLRIQLATGTAAVFLVLPKRLASIRTDDTSARDDAVAKIEAARVSE